jgi:hypothetical protein
MKILYIFLALSSSLLADDKQFIRSSEYSNWPFIEREYTLGCLEREGRPMVYIFTIDDMFGINGAGRGLGKKLLGWKDGESQLKKGKLPIALQPFIDKGLRLCK